MICESQLISIINDNNNKVINKVINKVPNKVINKVINKVTNSSNTLNIFFNFYNKSKLKSNLNYIYNFTNIPKESFYISLYYLNIYAKNNNYLINNSVIINNYVIASIIIANKQLLDNFNVKYFCYLMDFNFDLFREIELDILKNINWNTYFNTQDYLTFKSFLEHYMD